MENIVPIIPVSNSEMWRPWCDEPVEAPNYFPNKRSVKHEVEIGKPYTLPRNQDNGAAANPCSVNMEFKNKKHNYTLPCRQESDALLDPSLPAISTIEADNLVNMERTQPDLLTPSGLLEEKFLCDTCQESYISTNILQNHLCAKKLKKMSSCDELNKLYSSRVITNTDNVGTVYSANRRNNASNCSPTLLGVTQRSDTKTIRHHCDQCEKSFPSLSKLNRHKHIHRGKNPYPCDECPMSFWQNSHLKRHIRTHTGERPYPCDKCSMSFSQSSSLKIHMRIHTGERPYPCDKCSMSFSRRDILKIHMRTHTGERPYPCDKCSMSFSLRANLKSHMLTHTEERPYKCNHCNFSSSQSGSLKRHKRLHTV